MQQLDQPVAENIPEAGCGMDSPMPTPAVQSPPVTPPSMSVNLNAQGMDNIEDLLKLITKVNPDMEKPAMPPLPSMGMDTGIASIKPSLPPLKMLPDLDNEPEGDHPEPDADNFGGPSDNDADNKIDVIQKSMGDMDGDGDKDEKDDEKDDKKEWANSADNASDEYTGDVNDVIPSGDDLHKKKAMFKAAAGGDNPMAAESDLRSQIRSELMRRLEEAKKS